MLTLSGWRSRGQQSSVSSHSFTRGTVVLTVLWEGLKATGITFGRYVIIGIILILAIIFLPRGLVSLPEEIRERLKRPQQKSTEERK